MFGYPTVRSLAAHLGPRRQDGGDRAAARARTGPRPGVRQCGAAGQCSTRPPPVVVWRRALLVVRPSRSSRRAAGTTGSAATTRPRRRPPSGEVPRATARQGRRPGRRRRRTGDVTVIAPTGNADGWGAKQWLYFPADQYAAARDIVRRRASRAAGRSSSTGSPTAPRSPPPCTATARPSAGGCAGHRRRPGHRPRRRRLHAGPGVGVTLYATGALERHGAAGLEVRDGRLDVRGWRDDRHRCLRGEARDPRRQSPHTDHQPYLDAPDTTQWR